jgi:hypothetical protein
VARRIFQHIKYVIIAKTLGIGTVSEMQELFVVPLEQVNARAVSAYPHITLAILVQRMNGIIIKAAVIDVVLADIVKLLPVGPQDTYPAIVSTDQDISGIVLAQR